MQKSQIISYSRDNCYLIKDQSYKAGQFIGRIDSIGLNEVNLIIYIFPEDTKEGRKQHMSNSEIFLTNNKMKYKFSGNETQIIVTNLSNYINKKYIKKQNLSFHQLYFHRQKYLEDGSFEPILQKICYCQQYFNPDYVFKICKCGCYFHPNCFMKAKTKKCWNENCHVDCSIFFSPEEMSKKNIKINESQVEPSIINSQEKFTIEPTNEEFLNRESSFKKGIKSIIKEKVIFNTDSLYKKSKNNNKYKNSTIEMFFIKVEPNENEENTKQECFNNKGSLTEKKMLSENKSKKKMFYTTICEKKPGGGGDQTQVKKVSNFSDRGRAFKVISDNLKNGIEYLQKNPQIIDDFVKHKPNLKEHISFIKDNNETVIKNFYNDLAKSIENNLYNNCDKNTNTTYFEFLREFSLLFKKSKKILIRVILGDLTSEEISKFKGDDFLPEEKRREKEELKNKEIQKIKFKEPMEIKAISNKGHMLTEIQDNIDANKTSYYLDNHINRNVKETLLSPEYYQKLREMKEEYPNINENDIKFLFESKNPNEEEIKNKLSSMIQETLDLEEQKELLIFRKKKLKKKAERYYKKCNDEKDKISLEKKIKDYVQLISFDIMTY